MQFIFIFLQIFRFPATMADKENKEKPKVDLGLLEEDDEFEEFPAEGNLTLSTE